MKQSTLLLLLLAGALSPLYSHAFGVPAVVQQPRSLVSLQSSSSTSSTTTTKTDLTKSVAQLKQVLEREYVSFFDPMERDYYAATVSFDDPLSNLVGVDNYQKNVDMLAARTLLGKILFRDASIVLHSVTGGDIIDDSNQIQDITTRWTLRMTFKVLPWQPTARFSGVSIYKVAATATATGGSTAAGVQVQKQIDYWDSINLQPGGGYAAVSKGDAVKDFLDQLKQENMQAIAAAPELPFTLLRRAKDYQVRRYPAYTAVQTEYERRDEGFSELGVYCAGLEPLAPALMQILSDKKTMAWPLTYAMPGSDTPPASATAKNAAETDCVVFTVPARTVAVGSFSDASVEPIVRRADAKLRASLERDGLTVPDAAPLQFAQYDAVYSMGARRGEVWIALEDGGHPW